MMGKFRLQSAMEYLMTYCWAILIIAVTLGALAFLGVFSGTGLLPTACIASSGYICNNPLYEHTTGNVVVTLGQATGTAWSNANVYFVPQQSEGGVTSGSTPLTSFAPNQIGTMNSGQQYTVDVPVSSSSGTSVGTALQGYLWISYTTTQSGSTVLDTEFATLTAKAS